jgi:putative ABC transport system permease protein
MATPLAWKNLVNDPRRLVVALGGIGFAVMLMFQQRGFQNALFDSTVEIIQELDGDIVLVNPARFALTNEIRFPRELLNVAQSQAGVAWAEPFYIENLQARLRGEGQRARPIRVWAFDLSKPLLLDRHGEINPQLGELQEVGTALIDRLSKSSYGFLLDDPANFPQVGELNGKRIELVGLFQSGRDFAHEGNLLMSAESFATYFPQRRPTPLSQVDLGLIKVVEGQSIPQVLAQLNATLGNEVLVLTRQGFIDKEVNFWARNTPIGVIFTIGTAMGFVVGVIICYQILASDIAEHMGEFATLKAMGFTNSYFFGLVIRQAIYLAILGFIPGLLGSWLLFQLNTSFTGLLMHLTPGRISLVLGATVVMCIVSGILALRKLLAADPASLF